MAPSIVRSGPPAEAPPSAYSPRLDTAAAEPSTLRVGGSATLNLQVWLEALPLRPAAGWAMAAAFLAAGFPTRRPELTWPAVVLLYLLVDPLWGGLWRLAGGRSHLLALPPQMAAQRFWLPYLQPGSLAAQIFAADSRGVLPLLVRVVLPTLGFALLVASTLGLDALLLTLAVAAAAVLGWISLRALHRRPTVLEAAVTIAFPWLLTLLQSGLAPGEARWPAQIALLSLWTLHRWGELEGLRPGSRLGMPLLAAADLAIIVLLIVIRAPLWVALYAVLALPTWLLLVYRQPLRRLMPWWLLAMLVSGLGAGQSF